MNIFDQNFRTYDEDLDKFKIDGNYLLNFIHSDGFSRRGLSINFLVDKKYNYFLKVETSEYLKNTIQNFNFYLEGILPFYLKESLSIILSKDKILLKESYAEIHQGATDQGSQSYVLNLKKNIHSFDIDLNIETIKSKFETKYEIRFYEFHKSLMEWLNNLYTLIEAAHS